MNYNYVAMESQNGNPDVFRMYGEQTLEDAVKRIKDGSGKGYVYGQTGKGKKKIAKYVTDKGNKADMLKVDGENVVGESNEN